MVGSVPLEHSASQNLSLASVSGGDTVIVTLIAALAVVALLVAGSLAKQVLAGDQGTAKMQDISRAVQEGAAAYLGRQFRTLAVFAVLVFFLLFLLPAETAGVRIGRSRRLPRRRHRSPPSSATPA